MESVLHIEHVTRQTPAPLHIGHTECLFYGETLTEDDENIGEVSSAMMLGAPLTTLDMGSHQSHVPLVKSIEYMPDFSRPKGNVYLETIHYLKDKKYLIPFRSKIRSGLGQGLRINHLPSLNAIRHDITGFPQNVCDPRSEIVCDVLLRDQIFDKRKNQPLKDWLMNELSNSLDTKASSLLSFDADTINNLIPRYINQVRNTPTEYTTRHLRDIAAVISPIMPYENLIPSSFHSKDALGYHLADVRHRLVNNQFNLRSFGNIPIRELERIEYNPRAFQSICNLLDYIPLTDFNIDMVLSVDNEIVFYQEHVAVDRLGFFDDNESGLYNAQTVFQEYVTGQTLNDILGLFISAHNGVTDEIAETISYNMVKIKLVKTISDEAAILLYPCDSQPNDPPLCGVYFDIALQSLAPMTIIPIPIAN